MSKGPEARGNLVTENGEASSAAAGRAQGLWVPSTKLKPGTTEQSVRVTELISEEDVMKLPYSWVPITVPSMSTTGRNPRLVEPACQTFPHLFIQQ